MALGVPHAPGGSRAGAARAVAVLASLRRGIRALSGEDAYERYAAHRLAAHPDAPMLDARAFWRERTDAQDRDPGGRCC